MSNNDQKFSSMLFEEMIANNPVLVGSIGLCPVVAICTSLKSAVLMSVVTLLTMIVAQCFSALFIKNISAWARIGLYTFSGMLVVVPIMIGLNALSPETSLALGIYLPLLAVNPLIVRQCERVGVKSSLKYAFQNAISCALGYDVVLLLIGLIREVLGSGSIWDHKFLSHPISALNMPLGGFMIIAFLAAALRMYFKYADPYYAEELAIHGRTTIKESSVTKESKPKEPEIEKPEKSEKKIEVIELDLKSKEQDIIKEIVEEIKEESENLPKEVLNDKINTEKQEEVKNKIKEEIQDGIDEEAKEELDEKPSNHKKSKLKKSSGKIVYQSEELEKLLNTSVDDLLNEAEQAAKKEDDK